MTKKVATQLVNEVLNLNLNSKKTVLFLINDDNKWMSKLKQEKKTII